MWKALVTRPSRLRDGVKELGIPPWKLQGYNSVPQLSDDNIAQKGLTVFRRRRLLPLVTMTGPA